MNAFNRMLGASLLTAGTCIGAGMLGFPIYTAPGGFVPAVVWFGIVYIVMSYTAWLMIQVLFQVSKQFALDLDSECGTQDVDVNFLSLAGRTLGPFGRQVIWVLTLIFLYCVLSAYLTGGISLLRLLVPLVLNQNIPQIGWLAIFLSVFIISLGYGYRVSDYLNRFFLMGLLTTYGLLLIHLIYPTFSADMASVSIWEHRNWTASFSALPILVTAFGYHLSIPSLKNYLDPDRTHHENMKRQLVKAVVGGGLLSLAVYLVWEYFIFQIMSSPELVKLSHMASQTAQDPLDLMNQMLMIRAPQVKNLILGFSFFALVSSCLGVAIGLYDFFADGLQLQKTVFRNKLYLFTLTFLPPSLFTIYYPGGFLHILKYAGLFAVLLLIIFPAVMMGSIRLKMNVNQSYPSFLKKTWDLGWVIGFGLLVIVEVFR